MSFEWRIYVVQGSSVFYGIASWMMSSRVMELREDAAVEFNQNLSFGNSDRKVFASRFSQFSIPRQSIRDFNSNFCKIHPHSQIRGAVLLSVCLRFYFSFQCQCPSPHVPHISKVAKQLRETRKLLIRVLRDGIIFLITALISESHD